MSDIRFNQWLHQSGTGGVSQVASGAVGVGTTNPLADFYVRGDAHITGILTAGHIAMGSSITFGDDDRAYFGDGTDLQIYHSGSHSFIQDTGTGDLKIRSSNVRIEDTSGNLIINASPTSAYLYSSGNAKLGTAGWGVQVTGILKLADATDSSGATNHLALGASNDLKLFHDGSHNRIHGSTGFLDINNSADLISITASNRIDISDDFIRLRSRDGSDVYMTGTVNSSVDLYYNGNKKFETTNTGAVVTGILTATGNIYADNYFANSGLTLNNNGNPSVNITSTSTTGSSRINFGDPSSNTVGKIYYVHDGDYMYFTTNYNERVRIKSTGELLVGTQNVINSSTSKFQVAATDATGSAILSRFNASVYSSYLDFYKSRSNTLGTAYVVNDDDHLGAIRYYGADGSNSGYTTAAEIYGSCDGGSGAAGDMPGRITFHTRPDGAGQSMQERLRITSDGRIGINDPSPNDYEVDILKRSTATDAVIRLYNNATGSNNDTIMRYAIAGTSASNYIYFGDGDDSNAGQIRYQHSNDSMQFFAGASERLRITSDGKIGINDPTPSVTLETVGHNQVTFGSMPETIISYGTASAYNSGSAGSGIQFGGKYNSSGDYTIFAGVHGVKANTSDGPYGGALILSVRQNNTSSFERMRVSEYGTITNTTASSHSQGAGTFNIKGVINQYSQGSGSGLIFDCDFGRLTGYSDDANVADGTNLSGVLAHSTTDWASSSSNTPIAVNGGTFQYRVGFGGYMEGISNGGRVSVSAGSGSPNMASTLNTASMTIESWVWYDGTDREVICSRWGSSFPNQFNMICDPNGQFHFNNGGVGAGSGNISGEHFPDKTWHHHVWQYDAVVNTVNRWYINGAFANSYDSGSSLAVSSSTGFGIFSRGDDYERWRGKIAIVRIYNRALSATEIKNHFELERGRFGV